MINKKECLIISLVIIIISLSIGITTDIANEWKNIGWIILAVSLVILLNIFAKKVIAYLLDTEIEMKVWRMGNMNRKNPERKPFPIGAFLPVVSRIIFFPFKSLVWMASLVFDIKPRIYRGAKRHGLYTFSDITEYHIGLIAASGIIISLISAVVGYLLGFPLFARLSIYYAFFNMIPFSELDGNKIFFGNIILWSVLGILTLIGMLFAFFMV